MIAAGAKINPPTNRVRFSDDTPIGTAIRHDCHFMTKYFLDRGARSDLIDEEGKKLTEHARSLPIKKLLLAQTTPSPNTPGM